jgi:hypothetical protein
MTINRKPGLLDGNMLTRNAANWFEVAIQIVKMVLNIILIVALAAMPIALSIYKIQADMRFVLGGLFMALFFLNIEKFEFFKFIGLEARLKSVVEKTYAALDDLRELALALAEPIVEEQTINSFQFIHLKYKLENVARIRIILERLGAEEGQVQSVCNVLYERVIVDHYRRILYSLSIANKDKEQLFEGFADWAFMEWNKSRVEKFIEDNSLNISGDVKEAMEDLEYFLLMKKLRREEVWQS